MTSFFLHPRPEAGNRVEIRGVPLDFHDGWLGCCILLVATINPAITS